MPVKGNPDSLQLGRDCNSADELGKLKATLQKATTEEHYDFLVIPLAAEGGQGKGASFQPSVDSDLVLSGRFWTECIVGVVSTGLDPDTASSVAEASQRCDCLVTELRWAVHLGLRGIFLPPPRIAGGSCCRYASIVNDLLLGGLVDGEDMALTMRCSPSSASWHAWNRFRTFCDHHARLHVALELEKLTTKPSADYERELERWRGEPVRYVIIPANVFIQNQQGFPVLPKHYKALLLRFFRHNVKVIISEPDAACQQRNYVARLFQGLPPLSQAEEFGHTHRDCLQMPLQPLSDNLESETYELFEQDPIKYAQYQEAVFRFLTKRKDAGRQGPIYIMVVGAGRGPLVAASLQAADRADVTVRVWAVEKNPNAVHTLRHRQRSEVGWHNVQVIPEDMRVWQAPRKADLLVSELLGSFGDNELSPECLDGAQRFLAEDGESIPTSYVSYLTPVSTSKLWDECRSAGDVKSLETGYVVNFHEAFYPCSSIEECFSFRHPNWAFESNDRYAEAGFTADVDALVHGFAGFFDCDLYDGVRISISPGTFSEGMFSWFPIFLPLPTPMLVKKGDRIYSHWWRRHAGGKAWYEWCLSEPTATPLQNPGGRSWPMVYQ